MQHFSSWTPLGQLQLPSTTWWTKRDETSSEISHFFLSHPTTHTERRPSAESPRPDATERGHSRRPRHGTEFLSGKCASPPFWKTAPNHTTRFVSVPPTQHSVRFSFIISCSVLFFPVELSVSVDLNAITTTTTTTLLHHLQPHTSVTTVRIRLRLTSHHHHTCAQQLRTHHTDTRTRTEQCTDATVAADAPGQPAVAASAPAAQSPQPDDAPG